MFNKTRFGYMLTVSIAPKAANDNPKAIKVPPEFRVCQLYSRLKGEGYTLPLLLAPPNKLPYFSNQGLVGLGNVLSYQASASEKPYGILLGEDARLAKGLGSDLLSPLLTKIKQQGEVIDIVV